MATSKEKAQANRTATITGDTTGSVLEDGVSIASGLLVVSDLDKGENQVKSIKEKSGEYGKFSINADGNWTYVLDKNSKDVQELAEGETVTEKFVVSSKDGSASKTVVVTITGTNDVASIKGDTRATLTEDSHHTTARGELEVKDRDHDQSSVQAVTSQAGTYGSFSIDAKGHWTYVMDNSLAATQALAQGEKGTDSFVVWSKDGSASQTVTVTLKGVNDEATITGQDTGSVSEDAAPNTATGKLIVNDVDNGENTVVPITAQAGAYGSFSIAADGSWTYTLDNSLLAVQSLPAGVTLTESFVVWSNDSQLFLNEHDDDEDHDDEEHDSDDEHDDGDDRDEEGHDDDHHAPSYKGASKVVTVTIVGTNDAAVISGSSTGAVTEDLSLGASGQLSVVDIDTGESSFQAQNNTVGTFGSLSIDTAGAWSYALNNGADNVQALAAGETATDTFVVKSYDGTEQQITLTIIGTNDLATISGTSTGAVTEDTALATGAALAVADVDHGEAVFQAQAGVAAAYGSFDIGADGNWSYALNNSAANVQALAADQSVTETFTVSSQDGTATQNVTINVVGVNDGPTGVATAALAAGTEDTAYTVSASSLLAGFSDVDNGDVLSVSGLTASNGNVSDNGNGTFTISPTANFNGAVTLNYNVVDGQGGTVAATQSYNMAAVNDAPVAQNDANTLAVTSLASQAHSTTVNWVDWTSSSKVGSGGTVNGTINLGGGQTIGVTYTGEFAFAQTNGGANYYTGPAGTYTSAAVANGPTGSDIIALSLASQKTLSFSQPVDNLFFAVVSLNGNGYLFDQDFQILSYGQGYFGTGSASRVPLADGRFKVVGSGELHGVLGIEGSVQSLTWSSASNEYWNGFTVGTYGKATTATATGNLLTNDSDVDAGDVLSVSQVNGQAIAGNSVTLTLSSGAQVKVNKDGSYLYDENSAFGSLAAGQTFTDSFSYTVADGKGGSSSATASVTITGINDGPTGAATAALAAGAEDTAYTVSAADLLAGFSDVDTGDILSVSGLTASNGNVSDNGNGTYTITPTANFNGAVTLNYNVVDGHGGSVAATQRYSLAAVNDAATISGTNTGTVQEDTTLSTSGSLTVTDVDSGEAQFQAQANVAGAHGTFGIDAVGQWTYTLDNAAADVQELNTGASLSDSFTVLSLDGTANQVITVGIDGLDDNVAPVAVDDTFTGTVTKSAATVSFDLSPVEDYLYGYNSDTNTESYLSTVDSEGFRFSSISSNNGEGPWLANSVGLDNSQAVKSYANGTNQAVPIVMARADGAVFDLDSANITRMGTAGQSYVETVTGYLNGQVVAQESFEVPDALWGTAPNQVSFASSGFNAVDKVTFELKNAALSNDYFYQFLDNLQVGNPVVTPLTEDSATNINVLANDTDGNAGDTLSMVSFTHVSAQGVAITQNADGSLHYDPTQVAGLQALAEGDTLTDTLTYSVQDQAGLLSNTATVSVVLQGVNDAPVLQGTQTEQLYTSSLSVWTPFLVNNGVWVTPTGASSGDTVQHTFVRQFTAAQDGNYVFQFAVDNEGSVLVDGVAIAGLYNNDWAHSTVQTVALTAGIHTVTMNALNWGGPAAFAMNITDPNNHEIWNTRTHLDPEPLILSYTENQTAIVVSSGLTLKDIDSSTMTHATVAVGTGFAAGDILGFADQNGISGSYDAATGVLSLSGSATQAQYQAALRSVTYSNSSDSPSTADRTINFTVDDGSGQSNLSNTVQSKIVVMAVNDAATISGTSTGTVTEDTTLTTSGTLMVTDADSGQAQFRVQANAAGAHGTFSIDAAGQWTYTLANAAADVQALNTGSSLSDSFSVLSLDGTASQLVTVGINGLDDNRPPVATNDNLGSGTGAVNFNLLANDTDPDAGTVLSVNSFDALSANGVAISVVNGLATMNTVGSAAYKALAAGQTLADTFTYDVKDQLGAVSNRATGTYTLVGVNDAATVSGDVTGSVKEDTTNSVSGHLTVTDPDAGQSLARAQTTSGTYGTFTVDVNGNWVYNLNNSLSAVQALAQGETVNQAFTVYSQDNSASKVVNVSIAGTNDAPVGVNDSKSSGSITFEAGTFTTTYGTIGSYSGNIYTTTDGFKFYGGANPTYLYTTGGYGANASVMLYDYGWSNQNLPPIEMVRVDGTAFSIASANITAYYVGQTSSPYVYTETVKGYLNGALVAQESFVVPVGYYGGSNIAVHQFVDTHFAAVDRVEFTQVASTYYASHQFLDNIQVPSTTAQISDIKVLSNDIDVDHGKVLSMNQFAATSAMGAAVSLNADNSLHYNPTVSAYLTGMAQRDSLTDVVLYTPMDQFGAVGNQAALYVNLQGTVNTNVFNIHVGDAVHAIKSFTGGTTGDVLNIQQLLSGAAVNSSNVAQFVQLNTVSGSTAVYVDADGAGSGVAVQVATLVGVTGLALGDLVANHNLVYA